MAKLCQIQRWFVLKPMGTYRRPALKYHRRRLDTPLPSKHAEHWPRCGVFLPSSLQTFHFRVGLFKLAHPKICFRFQTQRLLIWKFAKFAILMTTRTRLFLFPCACASTSSVVRQCTALPLMTKIHTVRVVRTYLY